MIKIYIRKNGRQEKGLFAPDSSQPFGLLGALSYSLNTVYTVRYIVDKQKEKQGNGRIQKEIVSLSASSSIKEISFFILE